VRLQQYSDQISELEEIIGEIEYEKTQTESTRQTAKLNENLEYYETILEDIKLLSGKSEDLIEELNEAAG
jgi:hypothetical protein